MQNALGGVGIRVGCKHWSVYLRKMYLKTASLMLKGTRASGAPGCKEVVLKEAAYAYGRSLEIAFQGDRSTLLQMVC